MFKTSNKLGFISGYTFYSVNIRLLRTFKNRKAQIRLKYIFVEINKKIFFLLLDVI